MVSPICALHIMTYWFCHHCLEDKRLKTRLERLFALHTYGPPPKHTRMEPFIDSKSTSFIHRSSFITGGWETMTTASKFPLSPILGLCSLLFFSPYKCTYTHHTCTCTTFKLLLPKAITQREKNGTMIYTGENSPAGLGVGYWVSTLPSWDGCTPDSAQLGYGVRPTKHGSHSTAHYLLPEHRAVVWKYCRTWCVWSNNVKLLNQVWSIVLHHYT